MFEFFKKRSPKTFLSKEETQNLMSRVTVFEEKTGCELVFHLRQKLGPQPLQACEKLFYKFGLHKTENRNAILVTLALKERQFAIWADEGVVRKTQDLLWNEVALKMSESLKKGQRLEALLWSIEMSQGILEKERPAKLQNRRENELSNAPITDDET